METKNDVKKPWLFILGMLIIGVLLTIAGLPNENFEMIVVGCLVFLVGLVLLFIPKSKYDKKSDNNEEL